MEKSIAAKVLDTVKRSIETATKEIPSASKFPGFYFFRKSARDRLENHVHQIADRDEDSYLELGKNQMPVLRLEKVSK